MSLYAELPARRARQLLGDALCVGWILAWIWLGTRLHELTLALGAPGRITESAATTLGDRLVGAGDKVSEIPLVGDGVAVPFREAAQASDSLADAGRAQVEAVTTFAWWLAVLVALVPIVVVVVFYLPVRWRFARRAAAGRRLVDSAADLDLFALRAMTHQPLHVLERISDDPAGAWRAGDRAVIDRLAALELASSGLRPPTGH